MALLGRSAQRAAVAAVVVLAASACGAEAASGPEVDRCVDRLLSAENDTTAETRRYVRRAYCEPFASKGWLHADGALRIAAVRAYAAAEQCVGVDDSGAEARTVPCTPATSIDCALLRHVRRSEVRAYVRELGRDVRCDDGAALDELGVP